MLWRAIDIRLPRVIRSPSIPITHAFPISSFVLKRETTAQEYSGLLERDLIVQLANAWTKRRTNSWEYEIAVYRRHSRPLLSLPRQASEHDSHRRR